MCKYFSDGKRNEMHPKACPGGYLFKEELPSPYHRQGKGQAVVTGRGFQLRDQYESNKACTNSCKTVARLWI